MAIRLEVSNDVRSDYQEIAKACTDANHATAFFLMLVQRLRHEQRRIETFRPDQLYLLSEEEMSLIEQKRQG